MGDISFGELIIVILVVVILFGPDKIPSIARDLGQAVRKMRGAVEDIKTEIMKETDNPVSDIKKEIEKVRESVRIDPLDLHVQKEKEKTAASTLPDEPVIPQKDDENYEGPVSR